MITGKAKDCLEIVDGKLLRGENTKVFRGVSINSRTLQEGELFVCIQGENFDGHNFQSDAIKKGAAGIILSDLKSFPEEMIRKKMGLSL